MRSTAAAEVAASPGMLRSRSAICAIGLGSVAFSGTLLLPRGIADPIYAAPPSPAQQAVGGDLRGDLLVALAGGAHARNLQRGGAQPVMLEVPGSAFEQHGVMTERLQLLGPLALSGARGAYVARIADHVGPPFGRWRDAVGMVQRHQELAARIAEDVGFDLAAMLFQRDAERTRGHGRAENIAAPQHQELGDDARATGLARHGDTLVSITLLKRIDGGAHGLALLPHAADAMIAAR